MTKNEYVPMVVGNIKSPTKWFTEGTKVYVLYITGNPKSCMVIGKGRGMKRLQKIWLPSKYITNLRVKDVYQPHVKRYFLGYHGRDMESAIKALSGDNGEP